MGGSSGEDASWDCCPVIVVVIVVGDVGVYTSVTDPCAMGCCLRSLLGRPKGKGGRVGTSIAGVASDG